LLDEQLDHGIADTLVSLYGKSAGGKLRHRCGSGGVPCSAVFSGNAAFL
jgi:hypothetical protein